MEEHRLTVAGRNGDDPMGRPCELRVPALELAGPWLEDAGFPVGAQVAVDVVEPGRLVVTRVEEDGSAQELLPLLWIPAGAIGRLDLVAGRCEDETAHG
jgi:Toxin SymE, type I toxin-antitoxin system